MTFNHSVEMFCVGEYKEWNLIYNKKYVNVKYIYISLFLLSNNYLINILK